MATEFLLRGEIDKAINIFEEEYSKNPSQNLYNLYLDALLKKNDFKEAEKLVVKQSKKNKNDIPKNVDLLFVYSAAGDIKKQEKIFKELTNTLKSSTYSDYSNAADLLEKRKLNDFAIQILEKGRDNSQNTYTFAEELAVLYEKIGNFEAATGEYVKIILRNREARQNVEASLSRIIATKMSAIPALKKVLLKSIQTHIENMDL
ncbi:MAG: hypothetical protein LBC89_02485 [Bacteroidales bacterium]|nr:hypothetical protein [Bacteroidales bacterium]